MLIGIDNTTPSDQKLARNTSEDELFDILCDMLAPLNDGHVELMASTCGDERKRYFNPELKARVLAGIHKKGNQEPLQSHQKHPVFRMVLKNRRNRRHGYSATANPLIFGYLRILELEGVKKQKLTAALDQILSDFKGLDGVIIDIRNNPGGDDSTVIQIVNRFCDRKRVAFHRKTKRGHGER